MKYKILFFLSTIILAISTPVFSQTGFNDEIVKIKSYLSFDKIYPNSEFKIATEINVAEGWHINSDKPKDEFLVPTSIWLADTSNFTFLKIAYPEAHDYKFEFSEAPVSVWEGTIYFGTLVKTKNDLSPGDYNLVVNLEYQACNDQSCLAPTIISDTLVISIASDQDVVNEINQSVFSKIDLPLTNINSDNQDSDSISNILEENGILLGLIFVFLGGLALNLTPCVYPLIPITIGFFGGQSEGSTKKLILMGIFFVLGLAVTYSVIGVATSLTGSMFGALLQNPIVIVIVALILVVLSLSMFGVYEFKLPDKLVAKAGGAKGGYYGAFFMGLTLGIVAAPCIGPFVLGLVTYVATKQDALFGFIMFFILALGLGTPYLFLAVFSGKIKSLPRSGEWMIGVEHIFGLILLGMALYFLLPLMPDSISGYILPVYMIVVGIYVMFFEKKANNVSGFRIFKIIFSVLVIASAAYALYPTETKSIAWEKYSDEAVSTIRGKGVIIDFYADWCIPCKELDASTFSDQEVIRTSKEFETYKADLTKSMSPEVASLREKYKIAGVPTILILDSTGKERERITGYLDATEFLKVLNKIN